MSARSERRAARLAALGPRHYVSEIVADHGEAGIVVVPTTKLAPCCAYVARCRKHPERPT